MQRPPVTPDRDTAPPARDDVLLRLHDSRGYDDLLPHSIERSDGGLAIRVVDLQTLIDIEKAAGRARDALVLPHLLALLARDRK